MAASRRERREREKEKEQDEKDRRLQEDILWQKPKQTKSEDGESKNNTEDGHESVGGSNKTVKDIQVKSKVRFEENPREDGKESNELKVPMEISLEGILDAIKKEGHTV